MHHILQFFAEIRQKIVGGGVKGPLIFATITTMLLFGVANAADGPVCSTGACTADGQCGSGCECVKSAGSDTGSCRESGSSGGGSYVACAKSCCTKPDDTKEFKDPNGRIYTCELTDYGCGGKDLSGGPIITSFNRLLDMLSPIQTAHAALCVNCNSHWSTYNTKCKCKDEGLGYRIKEVNGERVCYKPCTSFEDCNSFIGTMALGAGESLRGTRHTCYYCVNGECANDKTTDVSCVIGYYKDGNDCLPCSGLSTDTPTGTTFYNMSYTSDFNSGVNLCQRDKNYGYYGVPQCHATGAFYDTTGSGSAECDYLP